MANKDGGPAFPQTKKESINILRDDYSTEDKFRVIDIFYSGLTVRDYFAAAAMTGMLASYNGCATVESAHLQKWAYEHADAMLAEREK